MLPCLNTTKQSIYIYRQFKNHFINAAGCKLQYKNTQNIISFFAQGAIFYELVSCPYHILSFKKYFPKIAYTSQIYLGIKYWNHRLLRACNHSPGKSCFFLNCVPLW